MDFKNIYRQISKTQKTCANWYDDIVSKTIDEIVKNGFIEPVAYILEWDEEKSKYHTSAVNIDPDSLKTKKGEEKIYNWFKNIDLHILNPVQGIILCMEFTKIIDEEKKSYLLISFEDHVQSIKTIYDVVKQRFINKRGEEVLRIMKMEVNDEYSNTRGEEKIEKFTHLMRKNLFDKNERSLYN